MRSTDEADVEDATRHRSYAKCAINLVVGDYSKEEMLIKFELVPLIVCYYKVRQRLYNTEVLFCFF